MTRSQYSLSTLLVLVAVCACVFGMMRTPISVLPVCVLGIVAAAIHAFRQPAEGPPRWWLTALKMMIVGLLMVIGFGATMFALFHVLQAFLAR